MDGPEPNGRGKYGKGKMPRAPHRLHCKLDFEFTARVRSSVPTPLAQQVSNGVRLFERR
jgi:hypothetical protein